MSSNVISVYGIVGASGNYLSKSFDRWKSRTMPLAQKQSAAREFETLFSRLPRHATEPPIVFYRSQADAMIFPGMLLDAAFVAKPKRFKEVQFDTWAVCITLGVVAREVPRLRKLRGRQLKEVRWFCRALIDCQESMDWLGAGYIFIHFKPTGLSVDDPQIIDSLDSIPRWIRGKSR